MELNRGCRLKAQQIAENLLGLFESSNRNRLPFSLLCIQPIRPTPNYYLVFLTSESTASIQGSL